MKLYAAQRVRAEIRQSIAAALQRCVDDGVMGGIEPDGADGGTLADIVDNITLEVPRDPEHGDYATNVAMVTARTARMNPRELAAAIVERLDRDGTAIQRVEVAGPGFINFHLRPTWLYGVLHDVFQRGEGYGAVNDGQDRRVLVEFVSANPTGPLNVVNARHAALGDALANLLTAAGYQVAREFYVNDAGNQVRMLGLAMETRCRQLQGEDVTLPEGAYPGEYLIDLAQEYLDKYGGSRDGAGGAAGGAVEPAAAVGDGASGAGDADEQWRAKLARFAVERIVAGQQEVLRRYRTEFDRWFHESEIRAAHGPEEVVRRLTDSGHTYEQDDAVWLRTTDFGDDKDRVLVKSDGEYTYLVPDIAYHLNKLERGFDTLLDLFGQDHHGYHLRLRAALAALGHDPEALEVIYLQMVHLIRGGEAARMSKRQGDYVTLASFLDEVSVDAARYFFLMRSPDSTMEFDLDLANLETQENPVYYVQYAHARIAGIIRQAAEAGLNSGEGGAVDFNVLQDQSEFDLLRKIGDLPDEITDAAAAREPHRLTHYAFDLASTFHQFYTRCRVLGEADDVARARLTLVRATQITLQRVLAILGVSAPERM